MSVQTQPLKRKPNPRWWTYHRQFRSISRHYVLYLLLFNLYLILVSVILFHDGARYIHTNNNVIEVHSSVALVALSIIAICSITVVGFHVSDMLERRRISSDLLARASTERKVYTLDSDGEISFNIDAELEQRRKSRQPTPATQRPQRNLASMFGNSLWMVCLCVLWLCVLFVLYLIFSTPEAMARLVLGILRPETARADIDSIIQTLYCANAIFGVVVLWRFFTWPIRPPNG